MGGGLCCSARDKHTLVLSDGKGRAISGVTMKVYRVICESEWGDGLSGMGMGILVAWLLPIRDTSISLSPLLSSSLSLFIPPLWYIKLRATVSTGHCTGSLNPVSSSLGHVHYLHNDLLKFISQTFSSPHPSSYFKVRFSLSLLLFADVDQPVCVCVNLWAFPIQHTTQGSFFRFRYPCRKKVILTYHLHFPHSVQLKSLNHWVESINAWLIGSIQSNRV